MLEKLLKYLKRPSLLYLFAAAKGVTNFIPDRVHLAILFRIQIGNRLNLRDPKTFNEKVQWLKLNDRNPLYTTLVDKVAVKQWVSERIGDEYVTKTYQEWSNASDILIDSLPKRFVLKTNHDSGGVVICLDKEIFDLAAAKRFLSKQLESNYFWICREWPYKKVPPKVFAEEYVEADSSIGAGTIDYKFYCFNGEPRFLYLSCGLDDHSTARISFLNLDWSKAEFMRADYQPFNSLPPKPDCFDQMKDLARVLAKDIPFVRVDFFIANGKPRFSEMTFSPCGGFMPFEPKEWDEKIGDMLDLPSSMGKGR